jgi:hypothetical protein
MNISLESSPPLVRPLRKILLPKVHIHSVLVIVLLQMVQTEVGRHTHPAYALGHRSVLQLTFEHLVIAAVFSEMGVSATCAG